MPIRIAPRAFATPLSELDHVTTFPIEMHFARAMVPDMQLGTDTDGSAVFMGKVWDHAEEDIEYPSSPFDLRVRDGKCEITCPVLFAKGLLIAWAQQFITQPMIVQIPVK